MNSKKMIIILLLNLKGLLLANSDIADKYTDAIKIANGVMPRITIDYNKEIVHLIYSNANKLIYQKGDLSGKFGKQETIVAGKIFDPRIVLDKNGIPHVVYANGEYTNARTYYTNRIGGAWKQKILALEKCDRKNGTSAKPRATTPSVVVDDDGTVFVSAFISCMCRIENAETQPKVALKKFAKYWGHIPLFISNGELWIHKGQPYGFVQLDKQTLKEKGAFIKATGYGGEQTRASMDHLGDIHSAGGAIGLKGPGWYNSLSRAKEGKANIRFKTTMGHESGAAMPIRDRKHSDRVYVFHWSGAKGDKWGTLKGCKTGNQLHFARIENGKLKSELNKVTDNNQPHSSTFRNTPSAAAHPKGGVIVLFNECKSRGIYMTHIGKTSSTSLGNSEQKRELDAKIGGKVQENSFHVFKEKDNGYANLEYELNGSIIP